NNLGIGVRGRYDITDKFRADANFNYYFKKNNLEFWDLNANLHYLFNITDKFTVYPMAGLGYANIKSSLEYKELGIVYKTNDNYGKFCLNFGGGVDYALTEDLYLNAEVKYQVVSHYDQTVFSAGIVYKF
ncbi:MAG: porin family protein, partial [Prevotella shahii]